MDEGCSLWLPPLALAGCLRAVMLRDTRGRGLNGAALDNYLPATPLLTLYLFVHGDGEWLASPGFSSPSQPPARGRVRLAGPFTQPTHTRALGEVAVFKMLWLADAFAALTGIEPAAHTNASSTRCRFCRPTGRTGWPGCSPPLTTRRAWRSCRPSCSRAGRQT